MRISLLLALLLSTGKVEAQAGAAPQRVRVTLAREVFMPAPPLERGTVAAPVEGDGTVDARVGDELPAMPLPERQLKGTLLAQDDETVTIRIDRRRQPLRIPRHALAKLEVSRGRGPGEKGAMIGAGLGFALGFALGAGCDTYLFKPCGADLGVKSGAIFAVPGLLIGLLVPSGERWERVPGERSSQPRLSLSPQRGGLGLSVSIGF